MLIKKIWVSIDSQNPCCAGRYQEKKIIKPARLSRKIASAFW